MRVRMKTFYLLAIVILLASCSENNQKKTQTDALNEVKVVNKESIVSQDVLEHDAKNKAISQKNITCLDKNITEWFGFDEESEDLKCKKINEFNLESYQCRLSKNAFGAELDAIVLENNNQRIFAYTNFKDCEKALDIRNSNGP